VLITGSTTEPDTLLIRGGTVLSMDDAIGDHHEADVLIRAGRITAVGPHLQAGDATVVDARSLESLTPGKQADVIVLETDRVGAAPFIDPLAFVTEGAQPAHVRDVIAAGRFLKRDRRLTRIDSARLADEAAAAWAILQTRVRA
jgi:cytosine/adenosine deaminase-related metal-dependent hydrolase